MVLVKIVHFKLPNAKKFTYEIILLKFFSQNVMHILDSEWNNESIGITITLFFFILLLSVITNLALMIKRLSPKVV